MGRQLHRDSNYSDRLFMLIPAEFVSVYVAISLIVKTELSLRQPVLLSVVILFVVLIPIYLHKIQDVQSRLQIVLTTVSFLVWTYTLGDAYQPGEWFNADLHHPVIASAALLLSTFIVPLFHLEDTDQGRINEK